MLVDCCFAELISEILDSRTKDLVEKNQISGYVMSNALVSAALAMISESREVNDILTELLSAKGNETVSVGRFLAFSVAPYPCVLSHPLN